MKKSNKSFKKTIKKNKLTKNKPTRKKNTKKTLKKKQKGGAEFIKKLFNIETTKDVIQKNIDIYNKSSGIIINRVNHLKEKKQDIYTATKSNVEQKKDVFGVDEPVPIEFNSYLGGRISEMKYKGKLSGNNCDNPFKNPTICREAIKSVENEDNYILQNTTEINNKINKYVSSWSTHIDSLTNYLNKIKKDLETIKSKNLESNEIIKTLLEITKTRREKGEMDGHLLNQINQISNPEKSFLSDKLLETYIYKIIRKFIDTDFNISKTPISLEEINQESEKNNQEEQKLDQKIVEEDNQQKNYDQKPDIGHSEENLKTANDTLLLNSAVIKRSLNHEELSTENNNSNEDGIVIEVSNEKNIESGTNEGNQTPPEPLDKQTNIFNNQMGTNTVENIEVPATENIEVPETENIQIQEPQSNSSIGDLHTQY